MKVYQYILKEFFNKKIYLSLASIFLLFIFLGSRDIWTQEHRWASIVANMFYYHDFLHPLLGGKAYYDKPLLSYWLIALAAKINGELTTFTLRLPSALSGLLALFSIYRLGYKLKNKQFGIFCAWLLLTTFYFVFWARTSSADMLNLAGSLFAVAWYFDHQDRPSFFNYTVFFLIIALTCLCKGLIGAVIPLVAVCIHIFLTQSFRKHFSIVFILSLLFPLFIYFFPFWISTQVGNDSYSQYGLYYVYRENILRYFHPFDHKGSFYTYFIYFPIYLLPWTFLFIPAFFTLMKRYKTLEIETRWMFLVFLLLFLFFTLSGSRRSYYILPIIPFAILLTAYWLFPLIEKGKKYQEWIIGSILVCYLGVFILAAVFPAWYYSKYGLSTFITLLKKEATKAKPWTEWKVVLLDTEDKINFYLGVPSDNQIYVFKHNQETKNFETIIKAWTIEQKKKASTIFITRKYYQPFLQAHFPEYQVVELRQPLFYLSKKPNLNAPIAFIPLNLSDKRQIVSEKSM